MTLAVTCRMAQHGPRHTGAPRGMVALAGGGGHTPSIGRRGALALLLLLGACGDGRAFDAVDLRRIVPDASDAPPGTAYVEEASGYAEAAEFSRLAGVRADVPAGFQKAFVAGFEASAGALEMRFGAALYGEEDEARAALAMLRGTDGASVGLGEESVGIQERGADPERLLYLWRIDNLLLLALASGPPDELDEESVRALALAMNERALE